MGAGRPPFAVRGLDADGAVWKRRVRGSLPPVNCFPFGACVEKGLSRSTWLSCTAILLDIIMPDLINVIPFISWHLYAINQNRGISNLRCYHRLRK